MPSNLGSGPPATKAHDQYEVSQFNVVDTHALRRVLLIPVVQLAHIQSIVE